MARRSELADLGRSLRANRLVTVTGTGGVGKTRLAVEAARVAAGDADGAVFVALGELGDPEALPAVVAAAFGVEDRPGQAPAEAVAAAIGDAGVLVVFDNCEHVVAAAADVVEVLLRSCGGVRVLATSQEPLAVPGEVVWTLAPLAVPRPGACAAEVAASPAVELFCQRAGAARAGFALDAEVAPAVAELTRRLDGLPLAIELAAARVPVMSPAEMTACLDERFGLLNGGSRTALPRHRSLRATIEWSYDLCSTPEQAVLRRLAVFAGGATMAAVTEVCAGAEVPAAAVVDALGALVRRSLVVAEPGGAGTRYRLFDSVRDYARQRQVDAGEAAAVRDRHARWCVALAEAAEAHLTGRDQHHWLERLDGDHDNLRAALQGAIDDGRADQALRLAGALTLFWRVRGHFGEGRAHLRAALERVGSAAPAPRAKALWGLALMAVMLADPDEGGAAPEEALALYQAMGDAGGQARALLVLANCHAAPSPASARSLLDHSVALARRAGDHWCVSHALALAGGAELRRGDLESARPLLADAVQVAADSGDAQSRRIALALVGDLALHEGDYAGAETALAETLALTRELGESYGQSVALVGMVEAALGRGRLAEARTLLQEVVEPAARAALPTVPVMARWPEGRLAWAEDRLADAEELYGEVAQQDAGLSPLYELARRGLAEIALAEDDCDGAEALLGSVLDAVRATSDRREEATVTHLLGLVARRRGEHAAARTLLRQALELRWRINDGHGAVASLEAVAVRAANLRRRRGLPAPVAGGGRAEGRPGPGLGADPGPGCRRRPGVLPVGAACHRTGQPDQGRAPGGRPGRPGPHQRRDRRAPVRGGGDGQEPPPPGLRQAGRPLARRAGRHLARRGGARPALSRLGSPALSRRR